MSRYTMVEGNEHGRFNLYCYEDDDCVWDSARCYARAKEITVRRQRGHAAA